MVPIRKLRSVFGRVADTPSLFAAGAATVLAWVLAVAGMAVAKPFTDWLAEELVRLTGYAYEVFGGIAAPEAALFIFKAFTAIVALAAVFELVWLLLVFPTTVVALRADREGVAWRTAIRASLADWRRLLAGAVTYRTLVAVLTVPAILAAFGVYLTLGTLLEAVGYALGVYAFVPVWVPLIAVGVSLTVGRVAATAVLGRPLVALVDAAGSDDPPGGVATVVASVRVAWNRPRETTRETAVAVLLWLVVVAVVLAGPVASPLVPTGSALELAAFATWFVAVVIATLFVKTAILARQVASADGVGRDALDAAGGSLLPSPSSLVPSGRTVAVLLLVVGLVVAGGAVRVSDVRPGSQQAAPPGSVSPEDDLDRAVDRAIAVVPQTSFQATTWISSRELYPNGTRTDWVTVPTQIRYDRPSEAARLTAVVGDQTTYAYVSQSRMVASGRYGGIGNVSVDPTREALADAPLLPRPVFPWQFFGTRDRLTVGDVIADDDRTIDDWRVVTVTDRRLTVGKTDPAAVEAFTSLPGDSANVTDTSVRVSLDRETGYVRQVTIGYRYDPPDERYTRQYRSEITLSGYRTTEVPPPPGIDRQPVELLIDALYY